jgi:hypothetical protein
MLGLEWARTHRDDGMVFEKLPKWYKPTGLNVEGSAVEMLRAEILRRKSIPSLATKIEDGFTC